MYQSAEARPEPSQASKIDWFLYEGNTNVANYFPQKSHHGCLKSSDYTANLF